MSSPSNLKRFNLTKALWLRITLILLATLTFSPSATAGSAKIAIAANFTDAARDLASVFAEQTGHNVKISFGSTGKLYAQIENGAPFDVFLAADTGRPLKAILENLAVPESYFVYANGKLVLWSASPALFSDGYQFLTRGNFRRLAIANPKTAPYGLAAKQVLEKMELWSPLQKKLVRGDSIAQTFQFAATENAELGFIAASQAKAWQQKPSCLWAVPDDYYEPISQAAVLLNQGKDNPVAIAFIKFLKSASAHEIITGYGYGLARSEQPEQ